MTRIHIESPGQIEREVIDVVEPGGVVIGRAPDPASAGEAHLAPRTIPSPSVSANHAAVSTRGGRVSVRDLRSRNGTWIKLPPDTTVDLPADADVHLRLGWQGSAASAVGAIEAPRYRDTTDYAEGMAHAVQQWLAQHEAPAKVWTTRQAQAPSGSATFRLANGDHLHVQLERTVDERFTELLPHVTRYVAAQNVLFTAEESTREEGMILASPAIRQVHRRVVNAALEHLPRLVLLGPSGTGKERLAQTYHRHLARSGPLVAINCATLSRDRLVADLFGAEAGAYTGAQRTMTGAVERADGGTLFLDEVGEIPLEVQPLLLRFLDTGEYQRLGAIGVARSSNVFVVVATNRDLRRMVQDGSFRLDLYYRLALEVVEVPSLRERFVDAIAYLTSQSLQDASAHDALSEAALDLLREHAWSGNFRELVNVVRRLPRPSAPNSIDVDTIRRVLASSAIAPPRVPSEPTPEPTGDWLDWLRASANAFMREVEGNTPTSWSDLTMFVEQFLKPFALAHMADVASAEGVDAVSVAKVADRVKADRGTVVKQLRRFFEARGR